MYFGGKRGLCLGKDDIDVDEDILQSDYFDNTDYDDEESEGPTGNEGNPTTRWYNRAGIIFWPKSKRHALLCDSNLPGAVATFGKAIRGLAKTTSGKKGAEDKEETVALARAILDNLKEDGFSKLPESQLKTFIEDLTILGDLTLIELFIKEVAIEAKTRPYGNYGCPYADSLPALVCSLCKKHGWDTFGDALEMYAIKIASSGTLDALVSLLEGLFTDASEFGRKIVDKALTVAKGPKKASDAAMLKTIEFAKRFRHEETTQRAFLGLIASCFSNAAAPAVLAILKENNWKDAEKFLLDVAQGHGSYFKDKERASGLAALICGIAKEVAAGDKAAAAAANSLVDILAKRVLVVDPGYSYKHYEYQDSTTGVLKAVLEYAVAVKSPQLAINVFHFAGLTGFKPNVCAEQLAFAAKYFGWGTFSSSVEKSVQKHGDSFSIVDMITLLPAYKFSRGKGLYVQLPDDQRLHLGILLVQKLEKVAKSPYDPALYDRQKHPPGTQMPLKFVASVFEALHIPIIPGNSLNLLRQGFKAMGNDEGRYSMDTNLLKGLEIVAKKHPVGGGLCQNGFQAALEGAVMAQTPNIGCNCISCKEFKNFAKNGKPNVPLVLPKLRSRNHEKDQIAKFMGLEVSMNASNCLVVRKSANYDTKLAADAKPRAKLLFENLVRAAPAAAAAVGQQSAPQPQQAQQPQQQVGIVSKPRSRQEDIIDLTMDTTPAKKSRVE